MHSETGPNETFWGQEPTGTQNQEPSETPTALGSCRHTNGWGLS